MKASGQSAMVSQSVVTLDRDHQQLIHNNNAFAHQSEPDSPTQPHTALEHSLGFILHVILDYPHLHTLGLLQQTLALRPLPITRPVWRMCGGS